MLAASPYLPGGPELLYPVRTALVAALLATVSRGVLRFRPARPLASTAAGMAIFAVWVAPDLFFPEWHNHWLFRNTITAGVGAGAASEGARHSFLFLLFRAGGSALVVPVAEELFWRAWMMRRLISSDFGKVPLGAYSAFSFWGTAALFASEHGPYWDVGLVAGVVYNGWMVRTRSLADCILAHAVTNACLAAYVLSTGRWQYWL
ncbi:MAG TPA: CAAX prenyl protease-related protein [Bryobacteraceae bacterium]